MSGIDAVAFLSRIMYTVEYSRGYGDWVILFNIEGSLITKKIL